MICNKCGQQLSDDAKFCSKCGSACIPQNNTAEETKDTQEDNVLEVGDEITLGTYSGMRPANVNNGDKIPWKIVNIQPGMAMVVCSQSICVKTYHTSQTDTNWNDCALRQWLNNDFLKQYFSQEERNRILACNVTNSDNPQYKTPGGPQTTDKVFLLSLAEAEHIFADDRSRAIGVYWWLRTPGMYANYAACVNKHGHIENKGYYVFGNSLCDDISVRPAMWIKI